MTGPAISQEGRPVVAALLLVSDGRDSYTERTVRSMQTNIDIVDIIHVDDRDHELGFGGAIREGWRRVLATPATHVFHLEADYTFNRPVPVQRMAAVLDAHPYLAQLALRRQPWNTTEEAAGTVVPDDAVEIQWRDNTWLEHRRNFTTNPSLYPRWVMEYGWPEGPESEGRFSGYLLRLAPWVKFAYWGARSDPEAVFHIGDHRAHEGHGY